MELERDDFVVSFDASRASLDDLITTSKKTGVPATVVEDTPSSPRPPFFEAALARAKRERNQLGTDERLLDGVKLRESVQTLLNAKTDTGPAN